MKTRFSWVSLLFLLAVTIDWAFIPCRWRGWIFLILLTSYLIVLIGGLISLRYNLFGPALCRGSAVNRKIALTFDDGPDPLGTPVVLDVLARYQVQAAFFLIGWKVEAYPDLVRRIIAAGHVVGNHTYRHAWLTNFLWGRALRSEIDRAQTAIKSVTGLTPAFYRPPVGLSNPHLSAVLIEAGLIMIGWDVRPFDTAARPPIVLRRILKKTRSGSIILLHDRRDDPLALGELVEAVIVGLKEAGFHISRLDQLLDLPAYQENPITP